MTSSSVLCISPLQYLIVRPSALDRGSASNESVLAVLAEPRDSCEIGGETLALAREMSLALMVLTGELRDRVGSSNMAGLTSQSASDPISASREASFLSAKQSTLSQAGSLRRGGNNKVASRVAGVEVLRFSNPDTRLPSPWSYVAEEPGFLDLTLPSLIDGAEG